MLLMVALRYFWYWNPEDDWPPSTVQTPEEYTGGDRLSVACTQTDLSSSAQRKLVRHWCELLPSLAEVRYLWLGSKVPQDLFDAACRMPNLCALWVKWSSARSIDALATCKNLHALHLGSSTAVRTIDVLSQLTELRWLGLENLKQVSSLEPLRPLIGLQGLAVEGSTWTTQRVDTLEPIGDLEQLRFLSLVNLRSRDMTLAPLFRLRRLETFHAATWWSENELDELQRNNPNLVL